MRLVRRDDLDLLAGVVLAFVVATLGALGFVAGEVVLAAVLASLGLLVGVVGSLRRNLAEFEVRRQAESATLKRLEAILTDGSIASRAFEWDFPDLRPLIAGSSELLIIAGLSLKTTVGTYYSDLAAAASRGASIRIACPDPACDALMHQAALASGYRSTADEASRDVQTNLDLARHLREAHPDVEVGLLDVLPSAGLIQIRRSEGPDELLLKLLPFEGKAGRYPVVRLRSDVDDELFEVMVSSATSTWRSARRA